MCVCVSQRYQCHHAAAVHIIIGTDAVQYASYQICVFPLAQAKTSAEMGHWLGLLLSQTGSKTDPGNLTYDYVNPERISTIVSAARTSL